MCVANDKKESLTLLGRSTGEGADLRWRCVSRSGGPIDGDGRSQRGRGAGVGVDGGALVDGDGGALALEWVTGPKSAWTVALADKDGGALALGRATRER